MRFRFSLIIFTIALLKFASISAQEIGPSLGDRNLAFNIQDFTNTLIVRLYFADRHDLNYLASKLDIWSVNHIEKYVIAGISNNEYVSLVNGGYRIEVDHESTSELNTPHTLNKTHSSGIPDYPCYRTVSETYYDLEQIAIDQPQLASWRDIGDSWQKRYLGNQFGYDLQVLVISNQYLTHSQPKPRLFLIGAIHAREYATAETATRFAEHLTSNYGIDPDITWLLDFNEIHILSIANPDGRALAEDGYGQRKNLNNHNGGQCNVPPGWENQFGTDLNRNHTFKWGDSSKDPCTTMYQGPTPGSEPETQAIESYIRSIYPDQRGEDLLESAQLTSSGLLISLHSFGELVLWPWGWTDVPTPNDTELKTLGHKLAYFNDYTPYQSYYLYKTTGDTDDFAFGELGIAAYTIELGTQFFENCTSFENDIYPQNLNALLYAAKAARRPYQIPYGPESINISTEKDSIIHGNTFTIDAVADDSRYFPGIQTQAISGARYSIDAPSWITGTETYPMLPRDLQFNESVEEIYASVDTTDLSLGTHKIFIESQDADGNWGISSATFFNIESDSYAPGLSVPKSILSIHPGSTLTQTIKVSNRGNMTDTFNLMITGNNWDASVNRDQVGPLAAGESLDILLQITAPLSDENDGIERLTLTASSINDPTKYVEETLVVKTLLRPLYAPLVIR